MDQIKDLKARSDRAFDVQLQKQNLLESCRARQVLAHNGGIFKVDHALISFLNALKHNNTVSTVILDSNDNPVEIKEADDFLDRLVARNQEALNAYHQMYVTFTRKGD